MQPTSVALEITHQSNPPRTHIISIHMSNQGNHNQPVKWKFWVWQSCFELGYVNREQVGLDCWFQVGRAQHGGRAWLQQQWAWLDASYRAGQQWAWLTTELGNSELQSQWAWLDASYRAGQQWT